MNKQELIKQYDEKAKALRDEFISKLEDDKKEFELSYPKDDHWVFCVDSDTGEIIEVHYTANNITDRFLFEHGYYFETKEEAERYLKERKLLFKIHQYAKEKNEGWEPDWGSVFQEKYYIFYDYCRKELCTSFNNSTGAINKLPYFKTRKIAQECINLFGEEIKEVLV
ncbi:hypothetical protein O3822_07130 [Gemella sanguinis]|uniref:hypothetical protein n=1 Tax=Gemella sanguinis TaxID=84135 RepID=UPI00352C6894